MLGLPCEERYYLRECVLVHVMIRMMMCVDYCIVLSMVTGSEKSVPYKVLCCQNSWGERRPRIPHKPHKGGMDFFWSCKYILVFLVKKGKQE